MPLSHLTNKVYKCHISLLSVLMNAITRNRSSIVYQKYISLKRKYIFDIIYLIQNSQAVKKECGPQKGYGEKRCEIQGGGQEMAVMVG